MAEKQLSNPEYVAEIINLLNKKDLTKQFIEKIVSDYHYSDIADALQQVNQKIRERFFTDINDQQLSEIFAYFDQPQNYVKELSLKQAANIISEMDSDDAVDILEETDDETEDKIIDLMDSQSSEDVLLIQSYNDDEIGSKMTTNYIEIKKNMTVKEAMTSLIDQAKDNDNVSTIYVSDLDNKFYGAIDLKDLIIARENTPLESIITNSYPTVKDHQIISEVYQDLQDYSEDSFPVLNQKDEIIGIITANDLIEVVDEEMAEDYAKLAGLSSEEDLNESTLSSIKKRIPWLALLLILGMLVSSVVGIFESVVDLVAISVCFQSLILGMAGNVGTQSLAVTIRVLNIEEMTLKDKISLIWKEVRIGFLNGILISLFAFVFICGYIYLIKNNTIHFSIIFSLCISSALVLSMLVSAFVGTFIPIFFNAIKIDPAVASGPFITTINDLIAVICYYSLVWLFIIEIFHLV
ncbi:MAG: magnesium transporter [Erysipelotrichaceae bacterium]|nr:magnesium transporter [Erysipelotrichaceae bacterium]